MMPNKIRGKFYGLIALAAMVGVATPAAANIVSNPGFESGDFTGWVTSAPTFGIGVDTYASDVNSGTYGVYFGSNPDTPLIASNLSQQLATVAGDQYTLTFWLSEYQADEVGGFFTASMGGNVLVNLTDVAQQNFTQYTATFTASSATTLLAFQALNLPGFFGLDDISVINTSTTPPPSVPAPPALLNVFIGLLALRQSLRRKNAIG